MTTKLGAKHAQKMIESKRLTVLAGRYLAARSQVDIQKSSYGLEDFSLIQASFDNDYPNMYYLVAYQEGHVFYETVFNGTKSNKQMITVVCLNKSVLNSNDSYHTDYFGFLGTKDELDKNVLNGLVL